MSQTKQIVDFALHKFLEKIEQAIIDGFKIHKTPATYAKLIGGRYTVTMVKPAEIVVKQLEVDPVKIEIAASVIQDNEHQVPEDLTVGELPPHTNALPTKPTARGRKKADEA